METSDYYLVIERMLRNREVTIDQLRDLLVSLEEQGHITATEHGSLLELAREFNRVQRSNL